MVYSLQKILLQKSSKDLCLEMKKYTEEKTQLGITTDTEENKALTRKHSDRCHYSDFM